MQIYRLLEVQLGEEWVMIEKEALNIPIEENYQLIYLRYDIFYHFFFKNKTQKSIIGIKKRSLLV